MFDLHTHTLLSDGVLLPSELARRAWVKGYNAIAITDHVDMSNIDFVIPRIVRASKIINKHWKIKLIPGAEITHVPLEEIDKLVRCARKSGAKIVIGHGETISEPVLAGTNTAFINSKVDILAHPGKISPKEVMLAKKNRVFLEITTRKNHSSANRHIVNLAFRYGAEIIVNNDAHAPEDLLDKKERNIFLKRLGLNIKTIDERVQKMLRK